VARTILDAIEGTEYRLRWTVGKDAAGFAAGRPRIRDETWVALGGDVPDEEYFGRMAEYFGIEMR
jgi:hypothetical protein